MKREHVSDIHHGDGAIAMGAKRLTTQISPAQDFLVRSCRPRGLPHLRTFGSCHLVMRRWFLLRVA
jgi:hypothetical protein